MSTTVRRADASAAASGDPHRQLSRARAQVQDGSLDAAFALLDDVRAQSFALQLRLRNSLPVRWSDNALVMQRSSAKQSGYDETQTQAAALTRRQLRKGVLPVCTEGSRLDDESARAEPIEEELGWSRQRYRRKIEWDVAKRIARIDRELASLPPDQRFWNKSRNREQQQQQIAEQKEISRARVKEAVLRERDRHISSPKPVERTKRRTSVDSTSEKRKPASYKTVPQVRDKENVPPKQSRSKQQRPPGSDQRIKLPDSESSIDLLSSTIGELPLSVKDEEKERSTTAVDEGCHLQSQGTPAVATESEIDTMALYGPPATAGDKHNRKLNSDVLRRLFSDLDSDRDGHLNRIETCMALHRLQIAVPAPKIASFFRRVHAEVNKPNPKDRGNPNRAASHQPLKEVIDYKQFIAFVAAANDRQSAQRQRGASHRQIEDALVSSNTRPSPVSKQRTSNPIPPMQFSASISAPHERENALYELKDTSEGEDRVEQSVLKSIPDYLITRLLADERQSAQEGTRSKTATVVRKSPEKLLPSDSIDEKMVQEIAEELIREHLQVRNPPLRRKSEEYEEDLSGLKRAAVYFEKQSTSPVDVDSGSIGEGSGCEDLGSWLNLLTEEQVSALVPEPGADESNRLEGKPDGGRGKSVDDKETDTQDFLSSYVRLVAEKEVQASEGEAQSELLKLVVTKPDRKAPQSSLETVDPAPTVRRLLKTRTNLAKAVLLASSANQFSEAAAGKKAPTTSMSILQKLRAERKRYHRVPAEPESKAAESVAERAQLRSSASELQGPAKQVQPRKVDSSVEVEDVEGSSDIGDGHSKRIDDKAVETGQSTGSDALPPVQLIEKKLWASDDLSERSSFKMESGSSSSASSFGGLKSSGDSHRSLFSAFTASARRGLQVSTRRSRRNKWADADNSMSSSCRSSVGSEDLSEGEIERHSSLDLSDGEIFGEERNRVAMQKNASNRFFSGRAAARDHQVDNDDELNDTTSSIESGELLPITKLRSAYRERVLDSSFSSAESGELEDGLLG